MGTAIIWEWPPVGSVKVHVRERSAGDGVMTGKSADRVIPTETVAWEERLEVGKRRVEKATQDKEESKLHNIVVVGTNHLVVDQ